MDPMDRRSFLKNAGIVAAGTTLPVSLIELAFADDAQNFTFAYISDSHIQHIKGTQFVRNWDRGLMRAVAECNLMDPKPDFVVFGGDLAQLATKEELDHGAELLSALRPKTYMVMGEHDYYLDLGEYWSKLFGAHQYSFDHKGVHFVVLNSILTYDEWTFNRWPSAVERMNQMAGLDNPNGSPFMVGEKQRQWLKDDLAKVKKSTPVVVFSHSPLQKIYKGWNFWTEDAEQVQALLAPFRSVTVVHGHTHQMLTNRIGNIHFHGMLSTAWPWPYAPEGLPKLTVQMDRADPFDEADGTGSGTIDVYKSGYIDKHHNLWSRNPITVSKAYLSSWGKQSPPPGAGNPSY